jgi:hypothetical protein
MSPRERAAGPLRPGKGAEGVKDRRKMRVTHYYGDGRAQARGSWNGL